MQVTGIRQIRLSHDGEVEFFIRIGQGMVNRFTRKCVCN